MQSSVYKGFTHERGLIEISLFNAVSCRDLPWTIAALLFFFIFFFKGRGLDNSCDWMIFCCHNNHLCNIL